MQAKSATAVLGDRSAWIFFFQAEDGIRDLTVTGVQTCALPICVLLGVAATGQGRFDLSEDSRIVDGGGRSVHVPVGDLLHSATQDFAGARFEIGRAAWRGRGEISVVAGSLKKKKKTGI